MKQIDCNIIKDLLPSYCDKLSSDSTNKLIEQHLMTCQDCQSALKDMNEQINIEFIKNQSEQINYLRKYRKNKIVTIIFSIILTIDIILAIFISLHIFTKKAQFFVDVNDIYVSLLQKDNTNGKTELIFVISDNNYKYDLGYYKYEIYENPQNSSIYFKIVGKYSFGDTAHNYLRAEILETTNHIYIEDKKGNIKEIWNKDTNLQAIDSSYMNSYSIN